MGWVDSLIEGALARAAARAQLESPRAGELLGELAGRRLAIQISGTAWERQPLIIECDGQGLRLAGSAAAEAAGDATIIGAPLSLLALTREPEALIQRGAVRIEGDAQVAQRFRELGTLLAPDLEQALSGIVGRGAAHLFMGAARAAGDSVRSAASTAVRNVAEYLSHESGELVSRQEAEHFLRGVEQAREQLDRLEARLARLELGAGGSADGPERI